MSIVNCHRGLPDVGAPRPRGWLSAEPLERDVKSFWAGAPGASRSVSPEMGWFDLPVRWATLPCLCRAAPFPLSLIALRCAVQDLERASGSASTALLDQPWFFWICKVASYCAVSSVILGFLITLGLFVCWRDKEKHVPEGRLERSSSGKIKDSLYSKRMSTAQLMQDMKITFSEVGPPDPDAMKRAMERAQPGGDREGDGTQKLVPTPWKYFMSLTYVVRGVLNFGAVLFSFYEAMTLVEDDYVISRRVVACMETLYVGACLLCVPYGFVRLTRAKAMNDQYHRDINRLMDGEKNIQVKRPHDNTEDAHFYAGIIEAASSSSLLNFLPSFQKIPRMIGWLKREGHPEIMLWIENGKTMRHTQPFKFFCLVWMQWPYVCSTAHDDP